MTEHAHKPTLILLLALTLSPAMAAEEPKAPVKPKADTAASPAKPEAAASAPAKPAATTTAAKLDPSAPVPAKLDPSTPTPAKPAAIAAKVDPSAPAPVKLDPSTPSPPKLALAAPTAPAVVETKPVEAPAPQRARPKPYRSAAAQRVALTNASAKAAEQPAVVAPVAPHPLHWSYEGETGPHAWAKLAPEYAKCGNGERQSPIDIREGMKLDLEPIAFEYRPSGFKVIDNGHTIQANVGGWNSMRVMGRRFRLVQFHFHTPSEESIDGRQFDMVVHLVHKDGEGRLAVVAVLVEGGARQPAIQAVLNNLPLEKNEEIAAGANIDMNQMLPADRRYFTYMGSLTTPPCSEDVLWIVMKQPVQASADQLALFTRLYPMNARPTQATRGRMIKESN